ncbi:MAG: hypothetical protein ACLSFT_06280 [Ruminococcus callidus]
MTENLRRLQSRQAGFIQCFLLHLLKTICVRRYKQTLTFPMADAFSVCQFIPLKKPQVFLRLRLFHDLEIVLTEVFRERLPIS